MALVVLTSAAGAPGVTTTALGLTLTWPRPALLCDVDRDAPQAVLAGYLAGTDPQRRGLLALARAHREGRPFDVLAACLPLPPAGSQVFLPGFANPGQVALFQPVWPALTHALQVLAAGPRDVIVDAGRVGSQGLPLPLLRAADMVLLVTGSSLRSLVAARHHVEGLTEAVGGRPGVVGLVMVGPGRPYQPGEAAQQLKADVVATLPWDPAGAAVWSDGASGRSARLEKACRQVGASLLATVERRRAEVRGVA